QARRRSLGHAGKTFRVVIVKKGHEKIRMRIKRILAHDVGDFSHRRAVQQNIARGEIERKIEKRGELRVHAVPSRFSTLKKRSDRGIRMEDFAYGGKAWIDFAQRRVPLLPESARNVRESVDAVAIEAGYLRPPDAVLRQVLRDHGIFRVHVGQDSREPAV